MTSAPASARMPGAADPVVGAAKKKGERIPGAEGMLLQVLQHNPVDKPAKGKKAKYAKVAAVVVAPAVVLGGVAEVIVPVAVPTTTARLPVVGGISAPVSAKVFQPVVSVVAPVPAAVSPVRIAVVASAVEQLPLPVASMGPTLDESVAAVRGKHRLSTIAPAFVPEVRLEQRVKRPQVVAMTRLASKNQGTIRVNSVRVPTISAKGLVVTSALSWRDGASAMVTQTLLFRALWLGTIVRILFDTGSQAQLANGSLVERLRVPTVGTDMTLEFADGARSTCTKRTTRQTLHIQGSYFCEQFLVTENDVPGVDIVLGMGFAQRSGARLVWPENGSRDVPYLLFRDGSRWYGEDVVGGPDTGISCHSINARQTRQFVESSRGDISVMAVSVEDLLGAAEEAEPVVRPPTVVPELLRPVLAEYQHIFRTDLPPDLPARRADQPNSLHRIPLIEGAMPVKVRKIPLSWGEREVVEEILTELLDKGYISPASPTCPWSAPIFLLKKGNGDKPGPASARWRIITDYRALNALTKPSVYVPPSVRDVIDSLVHKRVFSRSDNLSGFYQAALAEEDREKTTFTCDTPKGVRSYFFNVSCLGLQGAPSSYQLFMEDVIAGIDGVVCYIDDLAYASDTMEQHVELLRQVFRRLSDNQVYLNAAKCQWGLAEMDFLGMHISHNHVQITEDRVQGLRDYPVPTSFADVRRFVGFVNYVGQFVPNFSRSIVSITDMLKGQEKVKRKFVWTEAANNEFNSVRELLIASVGLVIPDLRGDFVLETDASGLGMGAVLYQFLKVPEERLVPVWYLSRKFSPAEIEYNTRDREALAITWALRKCRQYLALRPFVIYSDHESLANFKVQPGLKGKDWRHQEIVAEFDFVQRYREGATMVAPDALSRAFDKRITANTIWQEVDHELHGAFLPVGAGPTVSVKAVQVVESGPRRWRPAELRARMRQLCAQVAPTSWYLVQRFISAVASFSVALPAWRDQLRVILALWKTGRRGLFRWPQEAELEFRAVCMGFFVLGGGSQIIPRGQPASATVAVVRVAPITTVQPEVTPLAATAFNGLDPVVVQDGYGRELLRLDGAVSRATITGDWSADVRAAYGADEQYGPIVRLCGRAVAELTLQERVRIQHYKVIDRMLYFAPRGAGDMRLCVPVSVGNALRLVLLFDSHETGVHGGVEKTYARLAARFFWPHMLNDVTRYINSCRSCRLNKSRRRGEQGALTGLPIPVERWQLVQMDWITDLPMTAVGFTQVLVVEDRATKYAYFIPAKKTDDAAATARRLFAGVFCMHGAPDTIISDRDRRWTSEFFGSLMALMHVKQSMGTSYYHDFNGALECLNKTVEVMLRHLVSEFPDRDFDELLPMAQWAYNTSVHSVTGVTPYYALYGVEPREPMNLVAAPGAKLPPAVATFAQHQAGVLAITRDALFKAQATMLAYENRQRREANFAVGEHVFLSTANLGKSHFVTTVEKLRERFVGPFLITEKRSDYKYRLKLPRHLKDIYPVFHASLLWRAVPTPDDMEGRLGAGVVFPVDNNEEAADEGAALLTQDYDGVPVYVIEQVIARNKSGRGFQYLIKWAGFPPEQNSWITRREAVTTAAARALDTFDAAQPDAVVAGGRRARKEHATEAVPTVTSAVEEVPRATHSTMSRPRRTTAAKVLASNSAPG